MNPPWILGNRDDLLPCPKNESSESHLLARLIDKYPSKGSLLSSKYEVYL